MNKFILVLVIIVVIIFVLGILMWLASKPISKADAVEKINKILIKEVEKSKSVTNALVLIESGEKNFEESFTIGQMENQDITKDLPFHIASIGKVFTATLIAKLIEEGKLSLEDKAIDYVQPDVMDGLFIFEQVDYKEDVTIGQLLNHTSGVADYFGDQAIGSKSLLELILAEPDRFWTPIDLINFSKDYQKSVGKPGTRYHYSDTGYILLGLIIEKVYDMPFHEALQAVIFEPLKMNDSYLMFYSDPENPKREIADIWLEGTNIKTYESLSIDWAGGGIISTLADLKLFIKALNNGDVISKEVLNQMYQFDQKFRTGIHYGYGFMEYHFNEFFPTLTFLPKMKGHMGVLGTQLFYDSEKDLLFVASFGSEDYAEGSVKTMIKLLTLIYRIK